MSPATTNGRAKGPAKPGLVVFTDLSGTLLDYHTYAFTAATAALRELKRLNVPLVMVSSKTRAEIVALRRSMGVDGGPFICENGAAIVWPAASTPAKPHGAKEQDGFWVKEFGVPYTSVRKRLVSFREETGAKCEGFGDWTPEMITRMSGIPAASAALAKKREYDEPFLFRPQPPQHSLQGYLTELGSNGLSVLPGARFFHLNGSDGKGRAVAELIRWYNAQSKVRPRTLAFGDFPCDWPMMAECDIAIAVKRPDGKYHPDLRAHRGIRLAGAPGPEGFNRMVLRLLKQLL